MPSEIAIADPVTSSCQEATFRISSALPVAEAMPSVQPVVRALFAGLLMTLAQIVVAVALLAPEGPLSYRYSTLMQHDGYWFTNIVNPGYETTLQRVKQKGRALAVFAFLPADPTSARARRYAPGLRPDAAVP